MFFITSDKDGFYMKIVTFDEIYNFILLSFAFEIIKMLEKII
jgi:hypothetical protein